MRYTEQQRSDPFRTHAVYTNVEQPFDDSEQEQEQTFTRREKKLYAEAIGQRTTTKRPIKKRKARSLGKAKQTRR